MKSLLLSGSMILAVSCSDGRPGTPFTAEPIEMIAEVSVEPHVVACLRAAGSNYEAGLARSAEQCRSEDLLDDGGSELSVDSGSLALHETDEIPAGAIFLEDNPNLMVLLVVAAEGAAKPRLELGGKEVAVSAQMPSRARNFVLVGRQTNDRWPERTNINWRNLLKLGGSRQP